MRWLIDSCRGLWLSLQRFKESDTVQVVPEAVLNEVLQIFQGVLVVLNELLKTLIWFQMFFDEDLWSSGPSSSFQASMRRFK